MKPSEFASAVARTVSPRCIDWPYSRISPGYGNLRHEGRWRYATHVVLEESGRPRPIINGRPAHALHLCDRPPCVNPGHLMWGDERVNKRHMVERGRVQRGADHYRARLDEDTVRDARRRCAAGESQRSVADDLGVSAATVSEAVRRVTWSHVD